MWNRSIGVGQAEILVMKPQGWAGGQMVRTESPGKRRPKTGEAYYNLLKPENIRSMAH